jgi:hypothetical protein
MTTTPRRQGRVVACNVKTIIYESAVFQVKMLTYVLLFSLDFTENDQTVRRLVNLFD